MDEKNLDKDGYLPVNDLLKFNKVKTISNDINSITEALASSSFLELDENKTKVKRKNAFIEISQEGIDARTVYVENLPPNTDHVSLSALFNQVGPVEYISLPKKDNTIRGFGFVEFKNAADVQSAIDKLHKYDLQTSPKELRIIPKAKWLELKELYKYLLRKQSRYFNTKKKTDNNTKAEEKSTEMAIEPSEDQGSKSSTGSKSNSNDVYFTEGVIVYINHIKDEVKKEQLKTLVESNFPVAFIDFKNDDMQAYIRCHSAKEANEVISDRDTLVSLLGEDIQIRILEGEEERIYWGKIACKGRPLNLSGNKRNKNQPQAKFNQNKQQKKVPNQQPKRTVFTES